jgi:FlaA1/EpsC-like NDP-sugar epimerase
MTLDPYALLQRDPIQVDADGSYLNGQRVMVTGAGGSIGSALCRHIARYGPRELIMLDRDESALHRVQLELTGRALLDDASTVLADIRDRQWIYQLMSQIRPDVVFHAAALKHQPLLERYPGEAVKTNAIGTYNVLRAAANARAHLLVNVSTDKAANPRCALGASKRIAERVTAWFSPLSYVSVRFGNVFNSRGSVLEAFGRQLAAGVPLTVTDPQATRYFMTVDEAVSLVIQAGLVGQPGEVLVLDMGEPVRISDIAERMIREAGRGEIIYTGLRRGEKVTEDLLGDGETDRRPAHPLIMHADVPPLSAALFLDAVRSSHSADQEITRQMLTICTWFNKDEISVKIRAGVETR